MCSKGKTNDGRDVRNLRTWQFREPKHKSLHVTLDEVENRLTFFCVWKCSLSEYKTTHEIFFLLFFYYLWKKKSRKMYTPHTHPFRFHIPLQNSNLKKQKQWHILYVLRPFCRIVSSKFLMSKCKSTLEFFHLKNIIISTQCFSSSSVVWTCMYKIHKNIFFPLDFLFGISVLPLKPTKPISEASCTLLK